MLFLKLRQPVNGLTHLLAAILSAVGTALLLWYGAGSPARELTFAIYTLCLVLLFSSSSAGTTPSQPIARETPTKARRKRMPAINL